MKALTLYDHTGRPLALGQELASGGEGTVYTLANDPAQLAKVYRTVPSQHTAMKLQWMVHACSANLRRFTAWPTATLHEGPGKRLLGFLMPRFTGYQPIHHLYNPAQRLKYFARADWRFLVHVARNCAAAFEAVHSGNFVVGDVNQSNVLVSGQALLCLIDCDSFQVQANGHTFLCEVGVPHYTPPELQGKNFRHVARTLNHDRFGLAVLIFQLLFMGRHPYAGRYLGPGDMPLERAIEEFRFAYGPLARRILMERPPHMIDLETVSQPLQRLFQRAFTSGSQADGARPGAHEWRTALEAFQAQLRQCPADPGHCVPSHLPDCPWCRISRGGGYNYFLGVAVVETVFVADLAALTQLWERIAQVSLVPLPAAPTVPPVQNTLPTHGTTFRYTRPRPTSERPIHPTPLPEEILAERLSIALLTGFAIGGLCLSLTIFCIVPVGVLGLLVLLVAGVWWTVMQFTARYPAEKRRRAEVLRQARGQLHLAEAAWHQITAAHDTEYARRFQAAHLAVKAGMANVQRVEAGWGSAVAEYQRRFSALRSRLEDIRSRYNGLQALYAAERRQLEQNMEALCRDEYLRNCFLSDYKISGIGAGRLQVLTAYGIESAYDVNEIAIQGIRGFGAVLTSNLMDWKRDVVSRFRFDPKTGIPESELKKLAFRYRQMQAAFKAELEQGLKELETLFPHTRQQLEAILRTVRELRGGLQATIDKEVGELRALVNQTQQQLTPVLNRIRSLVLAVAQREADLRPLSLFGVFRNSANRVA